MRAVVVMMIITLHYDHSHHETLNPKTQTNSNKKKFAEQLQEMITKTGLLVLGLVVLGWGV